MDPPSDDTEATDDTSWSCGLNVPSLSPRSAVTLWQQAFAKLRETELDPWIDFPTFELPTYLAKRHRYSAIKKKWVVDQVHVKIEGVSFDRGAMRECFRLKKLPQDHSDWQNASNYVAKRYISKVDRRVYFDDVQLQMEAKLWGEAFNRQNPPKKVDIFQLSVLEISRFKGFTTDSKNEPSNSGINLISDDDNEASCLFHIERFMEGEYRKYNSNTGFVDEQLRNTPQAFSHFTFERSGHRLLVVDIQGVGDLYTDPQVHTSDGVGYSDGNLGPRGMAYFFHSHRCNPLCNWLGLTPFDLAPSELAAIAYSVALASPQCQQLSPLGSVSARCNNDQVNEEECQNGNGFLLPSSTTSGADPPKSEYAFTAKPVNSTLRFGPRRRSVSFSCNLGTTTRFGPTVPRSCENMSTCSSTRRSRIPSFDYSTVATHSPDSASLLLQLGCSSLANLEMDSDHLVNGVSSSMSALCLGIEPTADVLTKETAPVLLVDATASIKQEQLANRVETSNGRSCLLYSVDQPLEECKATRDRTASGDSGYFGRVSFPASKAAAGTASSSCGSTVWFDYSVPSSPIGVQSHTGPGSRCLFSASSDEFPFHMNTSQTSSLANNLSGRGPFIPRLRRRNLSESSDIDGEEGHRMGGNLLHQLMHESHKPSCTDHPTNLDQEIGHSILGQIHHELARLHEAGRFLPGCKGGWSCIGLGGLLLNDAVNNDDEQEEHREDAKQTALNSPISWRGAEDLDEASPDAKRSDAPTVDWEAVLFHERHAAQLGCLEAMIVMAHYCLGLPTQLLFDCPIKPDQTNIRSGIDYLWRAAEGGDRRCMILLARYLDLSATLLSPNHEALKPDNFLLIPALQSSPADSFPSTTPDAWCEAVAWYDRAVVTAGHGQDSSGGLDDGLDAEGRYDAAEDLLPTYRILARMADMYRHGGFGLKPNYHMAGDLFNQAGELASSARQGRLAAEYFELAEEAYGKAE